MLFGWSVPRAVCVCLVSVFMWSAAAAYEDDIDVNYGDTFYNEIVEGDAQEATPSPAPCKSPDTTKWDKLFSMLENSQMRENMLLQYADDIVKVEMGSLRGEMLRFVAEYGGACGVAVETAGRRMSLQLETRLRETLEHLSNNAAVAASGNTSQNQLEALLHQLLSMSRMQVSRLAKLESSCLGGQGGGPEPLASPMKTRFQAPPNNRGDNGTPKQEVTSPEEEGAGALEKTLAAVLTELKETRAALEQTVRSSRQRFLPAGCEMTLLFPMRSRRIYTSVVPDAPLSLSSFTACMWVKPTAVSNRTVLLSYGTRQNPYEIQLLLGGSSALFTVGGEAHLVEGRGVVRVGGVSEWLHLCGAWSSTQGLASLWADGQKVASTAGVAEGHVIPGGGSLLLGQERNWWGYPEGSTPFGSRRGSNAGGSVPGFEERSDPKLAFVGKMTGVNVWDRMLSEEEVSQRASREGEGCALRGNTVAWGVTEMVPHGGAQLVN